MGSDDNVTGKVILKTSLVYKFGIVNDDVELTLRSLNLRL